MGNPGTRSGISSAHTVGGKSYIVDVGHGMYKQFQRAGLTSMDGIIITHLHSDHIADLFTIPWLRHGGVRAIPGPTPIYGPGRAGGLPPSRAGNVSVVNPQNPTLGTWTSSRSPSRPGPTT
ncbi:MBL fold metallo-hydrolase [Arthrobacter sp. I2-34]|uniref:MBL fold metallo-hydrolase n=1 Tax=Arthrobacter hankyongi TaxID=2904801 RepID=A0ABS9L3C0_9MICC|nr:MBL fold metallo-hydrolase [Arthrobacter hankyongi]MCG2621137.1 MBL fold metallo-hydrolase [Arthrobacter hankyongi]